MRLDNGQLLRLHRCEFCLYSPALDPTRLIRLIPARIEKVEPCVNSHHAVRYTAATVQRMAEAFTTQTTDRDSIELLISPKTLYQARRHEARAKWAKAHLK